MKKKKYKKIIECRKLKNRKNKKNTQKKINKKIVTTLRTRKTQLKNVP